MASGDDESLEKSKSVLDALAREVFVIKGGAGQGSMVKCVHQLLAGVHICAAAEAMGTFSSRWVQFYARSWHHGLITLC
jgi:putative dehydrogenase